MPERNWNQDAKDLQSFCDTITRKLYDNVKLTEAEHMYVARLLNESVVIRSAQDFFSSAWRK